MTWQQQLQRLREDLARRVGAEQIDDAIWDVLSRAEFADPYAEDGENLDRLEPLYKVLTEPRRNQRSAASKRRRSSGATDEYEAKRIDAHGWGLSNALASLEEVQTLRASLGIAGAEFFYPGELLESEAALHLPPEFFRRFGVPFRAHLSSIEQVARTPEGDGFVFTVWADPPDATLTYTVPRPVDRVTRSIRVVIDDGNETYEARAYAPSALWEVAKTSKWLAKHCPWTEGQCAWFLLSGEHPAPDAVSVRLDRSASPLHPFRHQRIVLEAPAWVPAETVLQAYRRAQAEALGGDRRRIGERNLELYVFVETVVYAIGHPRPPWRTLVAWWNALQPAKWAYEETAGSSAEVRFARDYRRTQALIRRSGGRDWQPDRREEPGVVDELD
jgi:hypothetical protein